MCRERDGHLPQNWRGQSFRYLMETQKDSNGNPIMPWQSPIKQRTPEYFDLQPQTLEEAFQLKNEKLNIK